MAAQGGLVSVGSHGGVVLGSFTASSTANTTPLTSYGTIWTADTGICMADANCYTKWTFQPIILTAGTLTAFGITVYGTISSNAWNQFQLNQIQNNNANFLMAPTFIPATNWFVIPGPSEQSGTGLIANPLSLIGQSLSYSGPLTAVRCVLTTAVAGTATLGISCLAIP